MRALLLCALALSICGWGGEEKKLTPEARRREYESVQKELEAARPENDATREQVLVYIELAVEKYGKFANDNPQTTEGFEAASTLAGLLGKTGHKDALKYAELSVAVAPKAGVDPKRIALCLAMVASGRLQKEDLKGSKEALEKIKELDQQFYDTLTAQFKQAEEAMTAQKSAGDKLKVGNEPFPIEEKDINGNPFSLKALRGKVVLIDFWATWCGPCMAEIPNVVRLYKEQQKNGFEVVGISLDKDKGAIANAMQEHEMTWPVVSDFGGWQSAIAQKWGIRSIPATYLLDRRGIIRHVNLRADDLAKAVKELLTELK
ncbi:MAG TPA: TlpA disulfide reductase family protein [Planctomycetota bacterium]